ncbi:unnamed protein product, partial [Owenia fusiformis]
AKYIFICRYRSMFYKSDPVLLLSSFECFDPNSNTTGRIWFKYTIYDFSGQRGSIQRTFARGCYGVTQKCQPLILEKLSIIKESSDFLCRVFNGSKIVVLG